ncbi:GDSL esterase/lipase [Acorus gramineus]|uniref:GDSL esterase/lipase n=1 Tax=Acorus gramineus TaxID=55184 RepID=A0AAV9AUB9_ACOGR|nr:GDSL esterase/lipase [Acorus gramineus]
MSKPLLLITLFITTLLTTCYSEAEVNGMFVFGSSILDSGNNNYLPNSTARADYLPYGLDFPLGSTGRFSNDRNIIDVLGELLGLPSLIPVFNDPKTRGDKVIHGVNYASGGSGILDSTGSVSGRVITLTQQINNFEGVTLPELRARSVDLRKYLFVVGTGGNDYLLNYFLIPVGQRPSLISFTMSLLSTLSRRLKTLYSLGARKFVLQNINPNGCAPVVTAPMSGLCNEAINAAILYYNAHLRLLVDHLRLSMPGSKLVYINAYKIIRDIIDDPTHQGFAEVKQSCCKVSSNGLLCERGGSVCQSRNSYLYFDGLHVTDAVNAFIARKAYDTNNIFEAYPTNVKNLARL